jgi:protein gp37
MSEQTAIEWCDSTWSPWEGCTKVSPGCDHCYAEGMNRWLRRGENWGAGAPRRVYGSDHWDKPLRWNKAAAKAGKRLRVFPSVCDPFDNEVAPILRLRFFQLIAATPHIDWLLLTKRIGNAKPMMDWVAGAVMGMPPCSEWQPMENIWLGATVVNQEEADRDIPKLLAVPARVRFISIEPMLGSIDLSVPLNVCQFEDGSAWSPRNLRSHDTGLHWVICGGESGPKARPAHPDWFRSLRDQCAAAGVPFMFKQHGEWTPYANEASRQAWAPLDGRGAVDELTEAMVSGDSGTKWSLMGRVGKKAAGRLLDGVQHDGFPEVSHA